MKLLSKWYDDYYNYKIHNESWGLATFTSILAVLFAILSKQTFAIVTFVIIAVSITTIYIYRRIAYNKIKKDFEKGFIEMENDRMTPDDGINVCTFENNIEKEVFIKYKDIKSFSAIKPRFFSNFKPSVIKISTADTTFNFKCITTGYTNVILEELNRHLDFWHTVQDMNAKLNIKNY